MCSAARPAGNRKTISWSPCPAFRAVAATQETPLSCVLATDLGLDQFDPSATPSDKWTGSRPDLLAELSNAAWRTAGDTVERLELLAAGLRTIELLEVQENRSRSRHH